MHEKQVREAVVRSAYRAILGREAEAAAVQDHLPASDLPDGFESEIEQTLRSFLESAEFHDRLAVRFPEFGPETWVVAELPSGLMLWVDLGDYGVSRNCLTAAYEPSESALLARIVRPGMTFVDIGANIGWHAVHAARNVGAEGMVIAFEPQPEALRRLARSFDLNGFGARLEAHCCALGKESAVSVDIGKDPAGKNGGGAWLLSNPELDAHYRANNAIFCSAPMRTLDELMQGRGVDVIKIDIEGAEWLAIQGATETLTRFRPLILSEINYGLLPLISGITGQDYIKALNGLGYVARRIDDGVVGPEALWDAPAPPGDNANYLFVPA